MKEQYQSIFQKISREIRKPVTHLLILAGIGGILGGSYINWLANGENFKYAENNRRLVKTGDTIWKYWTEKEKKLPRFQKTDEAYAEYRKLCSQRNNDHIYYKDGRIRKGQSTKRTLHMIVLTPGTIFNDPAIDKM